MSWSPHLSRDATHANRRRERNWDPTFSAVANSRTACSSEILRWEEREKLRTFLPPCRALRSLMCPRRTPAPLRDHGLGSSPINEMPRLWIA